MVFRKAFTLIELLVVIAIIAILAAILFPVFAQAKEAAKKTTCLSNIKGIQTAMVLYQTDSDDGFPNTNVVGLWTGRRFRFPIMPYLAVGVKQRSATSYDSDQSSALLFCPSDQSKNRFNDTSYSYVSSLYRPWSFLQTITSNFQLAGDAQCPAGTCATITNSQVEFVSTKVMIFEWLNSHKYGPSGAVGPWGNSVNFSVAAGRFEGARNLGFVDTHAKFTPVGAMTVSLLDTPDPNLTQNGAAGSDLKLQ
jgi:prepilin-type N-terminal cleavage/methylation domain-containing protein